MYMAKKISAVVGMALLLSGCSAPAEDTRQERAEAMFEAVMEAKVGEGLSDAYKDKGIYSDIASDLMENCGEVGMPEAYAAEIPSMKDAIIAAYEITCPS